MAEVEMTPVEAAEPPKVNPLAPPAAAEGKTLKLPTPGLRPGLKLPPKPGATISGLRPGLKLPPKPGATISALKPGLKLPPKPGATTIARPVIHKPGEAPAATSLPKPVVPVDAQGVGKLPTVQAKAMSSEEIAATPIEVPKPLETLKGVTQKLKGITQQVPQQAILHKTGIIAESALTDSQKEAAKHKTARISLSDAMGVAPVKNEAAPMKTIRIKRPTNLPGTAPAASAPAEAASDAATEPSTSVTQRKTLKIMRPGTAVRPSGKFTVKKPAASSAATVAKEPAEGEVADIPDLPPVSNAPVPHPVVEAKPGVGTTVAVVFKLVATIAMGALVWFLYENTQLPTYCGGLGWGQ